MKIKTLFLLILCTVSVLLSSCGKSKDKEEPKEEEKLAFYEVKDIVINPAGTNANRVMLVSVALQIKSEEEKKSFEERDALIKDVIVTSLSSKSIDKLTEMGYKDSLKVELKSKLKTRLGGLDVKNIYFQKYIIQ